MAARTIDDEERRARLAIRHRLLPELRTDDVVRITDDLVALHSSDPTTVYLSAMARMRTPSVEAVARALHDERSLVRHHAMRRTLWVFSAPVARAAHASTTVKLIANQRKTLIQLLRDSGEVADPDAWLDEARAETLAVLRRTGPLPARRLGAEVPLLNLKLRLAPGKPYSASIAAHTRVLLLLGFEGAIVRTRQSGSWINSEYHWAAADEWVPGGLTGADPATSAVEIAGRWARAFGPAPTADLQWWAGWSGAQAKAALAAAGAVEVQTSAGPAWVAGDDVEPVAPVGRWVALLPGLDPTTMGWKSRDWYMSPAVSAQVFDRNGNGGPSVWVDGRIVGSWVQRPDGEIAMRLLDTVDRTATEQLETEVERLRLSLGATRFKVRFPAPIQSELLRG